MALQTSKYDPAQAYGAVVDADIKDSLAQGSIYIGDSSGTTSELSIKGDAKILVGNGTTATSVSVSGDATLSNAGVLTIAADAVETSMIKGGNVTVTDSLEGLADAEFIVGVDGTPAGNSKVTMSGDVTMDNTGAVAVSKALVQNAPKFINAAGIKGLAATPIELVAAPGAGSALVFMGIALELRAGSEVLTEAADNLAVKYTDGAGVQVSETIETTGFIDQAANTFTFCTPKNDVIVASTAAENQALVLHNLNAEIAGNASNDAELRVYVKYATVPV